MTADSRIANIKVLVIVEHINFGAQRNATLWCSFVIVAIKRRVMLTFFYLRHMTELKACTVASLYQKVWLLRAH